MNNDDLFLARQLFWISFVILLFATSFLLYTTMINNDAVEQIITSANAAGCDRISSQDAQITCYLHFTRQGFDACENVKQQTACFTALGITTKNEELCHLPLLRKNLTFKNECMIGIIMERYGRE